MSDPFERSGPEKPQLGGVRPPSWAWLVGLVVVVAVVVVTVTLIRTNGGNGTPGLAVGTTIPPFAAPVVLSAIDGDVNLARKPNAGGAGSVPACSIRRVGVLTSCALTAETPLVLAFATLRDRCLQQLDVLDRVARAERGRIRIVGVAIRGDRDRWRSLAKARWRYLVVYDRDGAMAGVYNVEVCPQMTIVQRGGRVADTVIGEIDAAQLQQRLRRALRGPS